MSGRHLVHKLGPDGPFGRRYASNYLDIARSLTEIRTSSEDSRIQSYACRRQLFGAAFSEIAAPGLEPAAILEEARQIVDLALDEYGAKTSLGLRRACANLKVERAAIYGFRAVQRLKDEANLDEVWQFYKAARDSARNAVFAADSYFATDVKRLGTKLICCAMAGGTMRNVPNSLRTYGMD